MLNLFFFSKDLAVHLKHDGPRHSLEGEYMHLRFLVFNKRFIIPFGKYSIDLYRDGGFDGEYAYFFALLAEDSDIKDSNGFVLIDSKSVVKLCV